MTENNKDISKTIDKLIFRKGETIIEEIIEQSFRLLCNKLAYGGLNAENEIAFQCGLGIMFNTL